jgi:hypothetical protein
MSETREANREQTVEKRGADYAVDLVEACGVTGEVGCMDCIEGQCDGLDAPATVEVRTCLRCGAHDAFGELVHLDDCPLAHPSDQPPLPPDPTPVLLASPDPEG